MTKDERKTFGAEMAAKRRASGKTRGEVAESRPSSATHSAPNGASFVSAISAAPFLARRRG